MYNGEMNEKIKLLYRLHIPPGKKFQVEKSGSVLSWHKSALCTTLSSRFKFIQLEATRVSSLIGVANDRF